MQSEAIVATRSMAAIHLPGQSHEWSGPTEADGFEKARLQPCMETVQGNEGFSPRGKVLERRSVPQALKAKAFCASPSGTDKSVPFQSPNVTRCEAENARSMAAIHLPGAEARFYNPSSSWRYPL